MGIKCTRVEIRRLNNDAENDARRKIWRSIATECLRATNCFWETWWQWHLAGQSQTALATWIKTLIAWHDADPKTRGKKPPCPVKAMAKEASNIIYHRLTETCQNLHTRTIVLLTNRLTKRLTSQRSAHGSLAWWCNLLLYRERTPASIDPQPIPFDKANSKLLPPTESGGNWGIELRLARVAKGISVSQLCELWTSGKKRHSIATILSRIASGEYIAKGSQLLLVRGKWYAALSYQMPDADKVSLSAAKRAILLPGRNDPWLLQIEGGVYWRGGTGRHIAAVRKRVIQERRERQENYRWAATAQKGRGRPRATAAWTRLRSVWTHCCTNYNRHVAKAIVDECVRRGVGQLEYWQPEGKRSDSRFLGRAGKFDGYRDQTTYPWYQMALLLSDKCVEKGITFAVRKFGHETKENPADDVLQTV